MGLGDTNATSRVTVRLSKVYTPVTLR